MLAPLATAEVPGAPDTERLAALLTGVPDAESDVLAGSYIDRLVAGRREAGDSIHLLVMDAHRALNRLQASIATGDVAGAAVYDLGPGDEALVAAFMEGVARTSALRFDHPGLSTTATRSGRRLLIQNDLGTTMAHVVVLAVTGLAVTITYTDVHGRRLRFFEAMLDDHHVRWSGTERRTGGAAVGEHRLATGRFEANDRDELAAFLRHVGSRLVFVLDWNRARKRLETFVAPPDATDLLRWAADHDVGHIAFLALGAERLIYDAAEMAATLPARFGERLVDVLGRETLLAVTRSALQRTSEGMRAGKSQFLIRDELRVEVLRHVQASHRRLLDASADHASLIVECAEALWAALARVTTPEERGFVTRAARRAAVWEHRADRILEGQRTAVRRGQGSQPVPGLTALADDAVDDLEEAVFLLTLLPPAAAPVIHPLLDAVATTAVLTAREHLKALEAARCVVDGSDPEDLEDFLVAVDRVASLEHDADAADRAARAALVTDAPDFRSLHVADQVSRCAEDATDALLRSALGLREHILGLLTAR